MRLFFHLLTLCYFLNNPSMLYANGSSDDDELFFSPYDGSDIESDDTVKIYSSDSETSKETPKNDSYLHLINNLFHIERLARSADLPQKNAQSNFFPDNEKIYNFLKQTATINDILTDKSNHEILNESFPDNSHEVENYYTFLLKFFNVYPYSIRFEISTFRQILNSIFDTLPIESQTYLIQNTQLDSLTLDRVVLKLEEAKEINITKNQFIKELEIINQILIQSSVFFHALLESETPLQFNEREASSDEDQLLANAIILGFAEEDGDADDESFLRNLSSDDEDTLKARDIIHRFTKENKHSNDEELDAATIRFLDEQDQEF
ncbi:MAG: hypothetical protein Q8S31_03485 [Alphaproteobacteria bacterium]|nr:hypothetical protein [Alphaproteobacteria bacterium]